MKETLKIVIGVNPITKKNSQRIWVVPNTNRTIILPSQQYQQYEKDAGKLLRTLHHETITYPVNIKCLFYMKTRRAVDLTNLLEACDDVLVKFKIIKDDNCKILVGHDGSRVLYDKEFPRTEIYITPMDEGCVTQE